MRSGFAIVNKPPGLTSSDVVVRLRRLFPRGTKVGHMGTLDPGATGVLPVGVGKAARLFDFVIDKDKEYVAELRLGVETDTQDRFGQAVARRPADVTEARFREAAAGFVGMIEQVPPAYSAVKVDGRRLYKVAREGGEAVAAPRPARIDRLDLLRLRGDTALIEVACGRGTYIRTLIRDLGAALGCGAHMTFLVRTRAGPFRIGDALSLDALARSGADMPLAPMDAPLMHLPALELDASCAAQARNGSPLPAAMMEDLPEDGPCRAYVGGCFAGILTRKADQLRWKAMLLEDTP